MWVKICVLELYFDFDKFCILQFNSSISQFHRLLAKRQFLRHDIQLNFQAHKSTLSQVRMECQNNIIIFF